MGQSASLHGAVDGDARVAPTDTPLCPSSERNTCLEMEAMLSPPASSTLPYYQSGGSGKDAPAAAATAAPTTTATASPASASLTSVFCLDVSKQSLLLLRQLVETPAPDRASNFQALATHSKGILLNAPASTTIQTLQAFLLSHTREQAVDCTTSSSSSSSSNSGGRRRASRPAEHPSSMHVFALHDPTVVVRSDQGPVVVTREMSTDLLIPLTGAMELSALGSDATVLAFAATPDAETCTPVTTSASTDVSEECPPPRDGETGKRAETDLSTSTVKVAAPRTVLLLYTRDARFGFDGGDMMLIGCCVAICACIAAAICCCVSSAQKNKQQQSSSANNGKQDYYNGNNNNNYNNNTNGQYYSNNGNSNNGGYYNQPNGNYGNPYAGNGYSNNTNTNSGAPNGYGVPPNAYDNSNNNNYQNYQPQYQPQQQPHQNNVNSGYYGGGSQQPSGPAPL